MDRNASHSRPRRPLRAVPDASVPKPSEAAAQRLSDALCHRADQYRTDAAMDLTLVDALVRMDQLEAAAQALEGHRQSLHAMARDMQGAVAGAAVERDMEPAGDVEPAPPRKTGGVATLRRRVMALTSAAAVMVALALPMARTLPRTIMASIEGRSAGDIDDRASVPDRSAAPTWGETRRVDTIAPAPADRAAQAPNDVVRDTVRAILAADNTGGSAAAEQPSPATVVPPDAERAAREAGEAVGEVTGEDTATDQLPPADAPVDAPADPPADAPADPSAEGAALEPLEEPEEPEEEAEDAEQADGINLP